VRWLVRGRVRIGSEPGRRQGADAVEGGPILAMRIAARKPINNWVSWCWAFALTRQEHSGYAHVTIRRGLGASARRWRGV